MSNIKFYKINKIKLQTKILKITRNAYSNLTKAKIYRCLIGKQILKMKLNVNK